ncbi:hypothetical protein ACWKSP_20720 [Micromonosporaceae bacterium Da 78-11]
MPGAAVAVETLLLGVHDGHLTYRIAQRDLSDSEHPDAAALRLAGFPADRPDDGRMLHSTSWRFSAGQIVLTYAALPDQEPSTASVLEPSTCPAVSANLLTPSPPAVAEADVVAHACRHLAFLHHTDPAIAAASRFHPLLWVLLNAYRPDVAGLLPSLATRP